MRAAKPGRAQRVADQIQQDLARLIPHLLVLFLRKFGILESAW